MKTYVPFLRGKQNELMALRERATEITAAGNVLPLIEPVKNNSTTRISMDRFVEASMPFIFICNPQYGDFVGRTDELSARLIDELLMEYDNWTPAIQVRQGTPRGEIASFLDRYESYEVGILYWGLPASQPARALLASENITRHMFVNGRVEAVYVASIDLPQQTLISDPFIRQDRNADYPPREFFSDMNTLTGNPQRVDFGDFSIVGDYYMEAGGPTYAVALHHIHFQGNGPGALDISHFISDRTETSADPGGKTLEALAKLVAAVDGGLLPADTNACAEYRQMLEEERYRGLGYMKRLAIAHHLDVMLNGGIQLG